MKYTKPVVTEYHELLSPIVEGLNMAIAELKVVRHKGSTNVALSILHKNGADISIADCSAVHRAITPRLELKFGENLFIEVSSPGISRLLKDANEFPLYSGRNIRLWRTDISDWFTGVLLDVDIEKGSIFLGDKETKNTVHEIPFDIIAKAKLGE